MNPEISVVVPVFNEEGNVRALHSELLEVFAKEGLSYEIIYVNDSSDDTTLSVLKTLTGATIIDLARRYGQATALDAGFKHATGKIIVSIDGDGQNDPHDIPKLLKELHDKNLDVVSGWRINRKDRQGIKIITTLARSFRKFFINDTIHDSGCTLRVYRRTAIEQLDLQGEMHRYILAVLRWKGFRIGELQVNDRARLTGTSKYSYSKALRGFLDLIYIWFLYKYSQRPFHLFGYLGLTSIALACVSLGFTLYDKLVMGIHINRDSWFFLTFFFLLMAIMLFSFGVVIDLLLKIYYQSSSNQKRYSVRDILKI